MAAKTRKEKIINLLWNSGEHRPRAMLRFLLQIAVMLVVGLLIGLALSPLMGPTYPRVVLINLISFTAVCLSIWFSAKFFDRRPVLDFGLRVNRDWWWDLGFGLFLGAFLMSCIFYTQLKLGWISIEATFHNTLPDMSFTSAMAPFVLQFVCVGVYEELWFRGYHLKNMAEGFHGGRVGPRTAVLLAVLLSSSIFGLAHGLNSNATVISTVNIMVAGLFLGAGYLLTNRMALPIGLHITWNFCQGPVFGFPVSGNDNFFASFFKTNQGGPDLMTGGPFGPEAGMLGLAAIFIGLLMTLVWTRLRYGSVRIHPALWTTPEACRINATQATHLNTVSSEQIPEEDPIAAPE